VTGQGWTTAFAAKTADAFGDTFAPDVVLEATAMNRPVEGRESVKQIMAAARRQRWSNATTWSSTRTTT
jgi:ketosteroid isomerase-like protein